MKETLNSEMNENNLNNNRITKVGEKNAIEEKIEKLSEKKGKSLIMQLKLLFEINVNLSTSYKIYGIDVVSKKANKKTKV